jgi:hypothetical protein
MMLDEVVDEVLSPTRTCKERARPTHSLTHPPTHSLDNLHAREPARPLVLSLSLSLCVCVPGRTRHARLRTPLLRTPRLHDCSAQHGMALYFLKRYVFLQLLVFSLFPPCIVYSFKHFLTPPLSTHTHSLFCFLHFAPLTFGTILSALHSKRLSGQGRGLVTGTKAQSTSTRVLGKRNGVANGEPPSLWIN